MRKQDNILVRVVRECEAINHVKNDFYEGRSEIGYYLSKFIDNLKKEKQTLEEIEERIDKDSDKLIQDFIKWIYENPTDQMNNDIDHKIRVIVQTNVKYNPVLQNSIEYEFIHYMKQKREIVDGKEKSTPYGYLELLDKLDNHKDEMIQLAKDNYEFLVDHPTDRMKKDLKHALKNILSNDKFFNRGGFVNHRAKKRSDRVDISKFAISSILNNCTFREVLDKIQNKEEILALAMKQLTL